jgi:serine/threonine protein kinase
LNEFLGTPYFLAPEIIKKERYGTKCDIWSLGVIIFLLLTGEMPFEGKTTEELYAKIENGAFNQDERWGVISAEGKDFVTKCLTVD